MADVSPAALQAALLRLQSRRLDLISLVMARREEEGAPQRPVSTREVLSHRLRLVSAYVRLRLAIRACEALCSGALK